MTGVARKSAKDTVDTVHGAKKGGHCNEEPLVTSTNQGSDDVLVNSIGAVREGDEVTNHNDGSDCKLHDPVPKLSTFSPNVYANNKRIGRLNDTYECGAKITSASENVFAN